MNNSLNFPMAPPGTLKVHKGVLPSDIIDLLMSIRSINWMAQMGLKQKKVK